MGPPVDEIALLPVLEPGVENAEVVGVGHQRPEILEVGNELLGDLGALTHSDGPILRRVGEAPRGRASMRA